MTSWSGNSPFRSLICRATSRTDAIHLDIGVLRPFLIPANSRQSAMRVPKPPCLLRRRNLSQILLGSVSRRTVFNCDADTRSAILERADLCLRLKSAFCEASIGSGPLRRLCPIGHERLGTVPLRKLHVSHFVSFNGSIYAFVGSSSASCGTWRLVEIGIRVLIVVFVFFAVFGAPQLDGVAVRLRSVTVGFGRLRLRPASCLDDFLLLRCLD